MAPSAWLTSFNDGDFGWAVTKYSVSKLADAKESWVASGAGLDDLVIELLNLAVPGAKPQE